MEVDKYNWGWGLLGSCSYVGRNPAKYCYFKFRWVFKG